MRPDKDSAGLHVDVDGEHGRWKFRSCCIRRLALHLRPVLDDYRNMVYAVDNAPRTSQAGKPLTAFVSFPSPYTQTLLLQALVSTLPSLSISLVPPEDNDPPALQWHVDLRAWNPF